MQHGKEGETIMKKAIALAVLAALAGTSVAATDFVDTAPVVSSTPIVDRVAEPRQECSSAPAAASAPSQPRNYNGAVLGSIVGGLLGAQVGRGNGKTAAAAVGAAVGAVAGDRVSNPESSDRPVSGAVVGAAAGGLLGAQVGRGSGQAAAAAAGAAVGAVAGDNVQNGQRTAAAPAQQCRTVQVTREVIRGYTVVYQYSGRDVTVILPYDPGPTVRVGVGIVDNAPVAGAPTAGMMGSNVRDVRPAPAYEPAKVTVPVTASSDGGYQYRY
jgi:uncharacterized protein YcfJ